MSSDNSKTLHVSTQPLAVIGIGCRFPKAGSVQSYWNNIRDGVDAITEVPPSHWNPDDYFDTDKDAPDMTYARRGGFIDPVDFDPLLYGMSPNNIEATDTTQLLGMMVAREALLDAGYATGRDSDDGRPFDRDRTSVILGVTGTLELVIPLGARLGHPIWRRALKEAGVDDATAEDVVQRIAEGYVPWQENSFPGLLGNVAAGRIANRFDLGGTNCVVDAACASSLSALHMAAMELYSGRTDMAITGGLDTFNDIFMYMCFSKTPALSPTGNSRPFHIEGDGTILGEGLGVVVLKRLDDAHRHGDRIHAIIRGIGSSSDGRGNAIYAPSTAGQQKALRMAYREAGVSPGTIELVEAHGTGTRVGDAVEAESLSGVFREDRPEGTWCAIGSVKSMIGHTKAAAGVAGLIKCILALQHKILPPTIKVDQPLEVLEPGQAPVYINTIKRPWIGSGEHPRRAAVSAFGFGGSNFHAVLEEAGPEGEIDWDGRVLILAFSGATVSEVERKMDEFDPRMKWNELRRTAAMSLQSFDAGQNCRLVFVIEQDRADIAGLIDGARTRLKENPETVSWSTPDGAWFGSGPAAGEVAMVFPGQGSQYPGMLRDLSCQFPHMRRALELANHICATAPFGKRLSDYIYPIPGFNHEQAERHKTLLRSTHIAQPAIGSVSSGALQILSHFGILPNAVAGHSFGELTALMAAGVYDESSLYRLARKRGELMQGSGDQGSMLAVIATPEQVYTTLDEHRLDLIIANHNAPAQLVLSGATAEIDKAAAILKGKNVRSSRLPVSAAFHSSFVAAAEKPLGEFINSVTFRAGVIPVYSNTTAAPYPDDPRQARSLLGGQLARPVEFVREIENIYEAGVRTFIEAGPLNIITGLIGSILREQEHHAIALDASKGVRSGQYDLAVLLAHISSLGHRCDLTKWDAECITRIPEERKNTLTIPLSGANYVNPRDKRPPNNQLKGAKEQLQVTNQESGVRSQESEELNNQSRVTNHELPVTSGQLQENISEALKVTQQGILTLQKMREQTAQLHKQYLDGQELAQRNIQQLIQQQTQLLSGNPITPKPVSIPTEVQSQPVQEQKSESPVTAEQPAEIESPAHPGTNDRQLSADKGQYRNILLEVVAEKTGYPVDMLSLDMSLDTDLGIDSIKRVEILSALQERLPGMQQIQPEELGTFQLLQHIVEYLADGDRTPSVTEGTTRPVSEGGGNFDRTLLEVVAEKTGYPVDMLSLDMHLDSDLGIDSIKRVEILSELQERLPDIPVVQPEALSVLQTLQQIVDHMQSAGSSSPASPSPEPRVPIKDTPTAATIVRNIVEIIPLSRAHPDITLPAGGKVWIIDDGTDLPQSLSRSLRERELDAMIVSLDEAPDPNVAGLVIPVPVDADDRFIEAAFRQIQRTGAQSRSLACITRLGGAFGINGMTTVNPVSAALAGIVKTADKEWQDKHCKVIDIPAGQISADHIELITDELFTRGPLEVGITDEGICTPALKTESIGDVVNDPLNRGDVTVISGGARGVTAEVAVALANTFGTNLLLLGRSPAPEPEPGWLQGLGDEAAIKQAIAARQSSNREYTPRDLEQEYQCIRSNREVQENIQRMETTGVTVRYISLDVRDGAAVQQAIAGARKDMGPITGIIHGAGILADRFITDKTMDQFREVFSTKVNGLRSLLDATAGDELRLMVMFSSSTARFGRKGQADYAAANEVLNKTAQQQHRIRPRCRVISVNWGPWDGGMVTPQLKQLFESEGVGVIPLQAGAACLMREVSGAGPVEIVVTGSELPVMVNPRAATSSAMHIVFERELTINGFPVLQSHVINGRAVLPLAIIAEWLAMGAMHNNPGLAYLGFDELRTLRGVILENGECINLQILAGEITRDGDRHFVPVELRSGDIPCARARIILGETYESAPAMDLESLTGAYPHKEIYTGNRLFHGPLLQGIIAIDACSIQGISARVGTAPAPAEWMVQPIRSTWLGDPLVMDCTFQLMILWTLEQTGRGSLPACVRRYRQFQRTFSTDVVHITALKRHTSRNSATADIYFTAKNGLPLAVMEGYECIIDDTLKDAFSRNRLQSPAAT